MEGDIGSGLAPSTTNHGNAQWWEDLPLHKGRRPQVSLIIHRGARSHRSGQRRVCVCPLLPIIDACTTSAPAQEQRAVWVVALRVGVLTRVASGGSDSVTQSIAGLRAVAGWIVSRRPRGAQWGTYKRQCVAVQ